MIIKQEFLPKWHKARPSVLLSHPKSITIHGGVGKDPYSLRNKQTSMHFIIKDDIVLQCIPEGEIAYHTNLKIANSTSISILIMDDIFSIKSIGTLEELLKHLPALEIKRHYDWDNKQACPKYYTPYTMGGIERWEKFKEYLNEN